MLAETYVQRVHHGIFYTNRKTMGSADGIGKPLRYYTSLGCDCEAVFIKMLTRTLTWKALRRNVKLYEVTEFVVTP